MNRQRIQELLSQPDLDAVRQGWELTLSLQDPDLFADLFGGCGVTGADRLRPGPGIDRWVRREHHDRVILWALEQEGRLGSLRRLAMDWGCDLSILPGSLQSLHLSGSGRPMVFGAPGPDLHQLAALRDLRSLTIAVSSNKLRIDDLSFIDALPRLATLSLSFCRLSRAPLTITHPTLTALSLDKTDLPADTILRLPNLTELTLIDAVMRTARIEAERLQELTVRRCMGLERLDLTGCPGLRDLRLRALICLEQVTIPACCRGRFEFDDDVAVVVSEET